MNLKKATLLVAIGLCLTFVLRTVGTFAPHVFRSLTVAQVTATLDVLGNLIAVIFFALFLKDHVSKGEAELKNGTVLALVGSSLMSLLLLKGLLPLLDQLAFHSLLGPHFIEPIVPWVSSILILLFFITFHRETIRKRVDSLERATLWGVVGASIGVLLRTLTLFVYLTSGAVRWVSDFSGTPLVILLPVPTFGFLATLYFYVVFYREQAQTS